MTGKTLILAGLLIVSTSCGGGDDLRTAEPPNVDRVNGMSYVDSILYGDGTKKLGLERRARDVLISCMEDQGFDLPLPPLTDEAAVTEAPSAVTLETPFSTYGITERVVEVMDNPNFADAFYEQLSADEQRAFQAANETCGPAVDAAAFPNYDEYERLRTQLETKRIEFFNRIQTDPEIKDLYAAWSECMAGLGYDFDAPDQASALANAEVDTALANDSESPTARAAAAAAESRVATADSGCRVSIDFNAIYEPRFLALEAAFVEDNAGLMAELYEANYGVPLSGL